MAIEIPSVLIKIKEAKQVEVSRLYSSGNAAYYKREAEKSSYDFKEAITKEGFNLIAEFKKYSPSKGEIRPGANPEQIALLYQESGAVAISVLTDSHFKGHLKDLQAVRNIVNLPLLRKDFIIDPSQIYEARYFGADAILLISALLEPGEIEEYQSIAHSLNMDVLVESHNESEIERAIQGKAEIFGINNRNLHNFNEKVDIGTTLRLIDYIPEDHPIVTESGIHTVDDVRKLTHPRINAMLVGESIMSKELNPTEEDMRRKVRELST